MCCVRVVCACRYTRACVNVFVWFVCELLCGVVCYVVCVFVCCVCGRSYNVVLCVCVFVCFVLNYRCVLFVIYRAMSYVLVCVLCFVCVGVCGLKMFVCVCL